MASRSDWSGLEDHLTDDVIERLVPQATFDVLPDVLEQWYGGLCDGIVLGIPEDADDDPARTLVRRCRAIPGRGPQASSVSMSTS